jgi:hypothetical protein
MLKAMKANRRTGLCKKGLHRMTPANTYSHPEKGAQCRTCIREYMRLYMKKRRARMARLRKRAARPARGRAR